MEVRYSATQQVPSTVEMHDHGGVEMEMVGKKVLIVGVVAKPTLNGQSGRVEAYASQQVEKMVTGLASHPDARLACSELKRGHSYAVLTRLHTALHAGQG